MLLDVLELVVACAAVSLAWLPLGHLNAVTVGESHPFEFGFGVRRLVRGRPVHALRVFGLPHRCGVNSAIMPPRAIDSHRQLRLLSSRGTACAPVHVQDIAPALAAMISTEILPTQTAVLPLSLR